MGELYHRKINMASLQPLLTVALMNVITASQWLPGYHIFCFDMLFIQLTRCAFKSAKAAESLKVHVLHVFDGQ